MTSAAEKTDPPRETHGWKTTWLTVGLSFGAAIIGAGAGVLVGLLQVDAEDDRVLRQQRADNYSRLLSSVSEFSASYPGAKRWAEGDLQAESEWDLMLEKHAAVQDAASLVSLVGSDMVEDAGVGLSDGVTNVRRDLEELFLAPAREAKRLAPMADRSLEALEPRKREYLAAAKEDIVQEDSDFWPF